MGDRALMHQNRALPYGRATDTVSDAATNSIARVAFIVP